MKENNEINLNLYQLVAIIIFILGIIGSINLGNIYEYDYEFNWFLFLYGVISCFILALFIWGLGTVIDILINIEYSILRNSKSIQTDSSCYLENTKKNN